MYKPIEHTLNNKNYTKKLLELTYNKKSVVLNNNNKIEINKIRNDSSNHIQKERVKGKESSVIMNMNLNNRSLKKSIIENDISEILNRSNNTNNIYVRNTSNKINVKKEYVKLPDSKDSKSGNIFFNYITSNNKNLLSKFEDNISMFNKSINDTMPNDTEMKRVNKVTLRKNTITPMIKEKKTNNSYILYDKKSRSQVPSNLVSNIASRILTLNSSASDEDKEKNDQTDINDKEKDNGITKDKNSNITDQQTNKTQIEKVPSPKTNPKIMHDKILQTDDEITHKIEELVNIDYKNVIDILQTYIKFLNDNIKNNHIKYETQISEIKTENKKLKTENNYLYDKNKELQLQFLKMYIQAMNYENVKIEQEKNENILCSKLLEENKYLRIISERVISNKFKKIEMPVDNYYDCLRTYGKSANSNSTKQKNIDNLNETMVKYNDKDNIHEESRSSNRSFSSYDSKETVIKDVKSYDDYEEPPSKDSNNHHVASRNIPQKKYNFNNSPIVSSNNNKLKQKMFLFYKTPRDKETVNP